MTSLPHGAAGQARHRSRPRRSRPGSIPGRLTAPALRVLIGASVYREPAGRNALLFQIGQADTAALPAPFEAAPVEAAPVGPAPNGAVRDAGGPGADGPGAGDGPVPPFHAPADLANLISECEQAGLLEVHRLAARAGSTGARLPPVFVDRQIASALHHDLATARRGDEIISAHRRAAEYWQWRAAAWPQDRHADLHDLLEARYHLRQAGESCRAGTITEVVCAQLHAWGELDHEAALVQETLAWLPPDSPLRAAWIHEIGKIAQTRGNLIEAERRYQQSLEMFANAGDVAAASRSQHRLGILAQARGDYAEAEHRYRQSRDLSGEQPSAGPGHLVAIRDGERIRDAEEADREWLDAPPHDAALPDTSLPGDDVPGKGRSRLGMQVLLSSVLAIATGLAGLSAAGIIRMPPQHARGAPPSAAKDHPAPAAVIRRQAAGWLARQVSRGAIVSCDPAMCAALHAAGLPGANLLMLGPSAEDPLGSDVVVATAALRSLFGSRLASVYAPAVVAVFGTGKTRIQIRVVAPDGAVAYRNAWRIDLLARKVAGAQLVHNKQVRVSHAARKQLAGGQVDARLLTTIAAMAHQHALRIIAFSDSGPGAAPGTPLRSAKISAPGGTVSRVPAGSAMASPVSTRFTRSVLAFLHVQRPPYLAATLRAVTADGRPAVLVGFAGPSPLGLLSSGGASTDTRP